MTGRANPPSAPHIAAIDGLQLRRSLLAQLQKPRLQSVHVVSYWYNDFDLISGRKDSPAATGLVRLLERVALDGARVVVITRDPMGSNRRVDPSDLPSDLPSWYRGLRRLLSAGVDVRLHPTLHAKAYLMESAGGQYFFAVGSSNLTFQGMGEKWAECNVRGFIGSEYELVLRNVQGLSVERGARDFQTWDSENRRTDHGRQLLRAARA